ncbi:NAD-dependent epimerase/dehydratase family protein [Lacticaseibacillus paracasei]|uniref:NAD-dependent epimerase/dehydratase family protein n=1 Tax=Lacticaseibacillus paracasei TaxID=1597 RepID=UPI00019C9BDE|nr:NAD-dependent epimerase/dehydratase family protein [Lacticaseibacillus paracasei]EEI68393.1 hypothetical protein HMPREF0530_1340 [Lacticaseibacillus paracasei subsp. paracasei ATCC 25302 = DSM 5622 = JCM 8130]KRM64139.1 NAD-dependent epimerase dehydratase [Lacticaseibacillus paracasei subsp. paracasei ATCC 25302 = DSM 5622 = JCM 8130]MBA4473685.1 NAD-dependent epimerase/dehydratase family protein [Lacticaseibacillus paracasei]MCU6431736.1 NAD-dependent epimerase/dehydratase family protein [L
MRILILGGTGAMGVALVKLLSESNNQVYVTSRSHHTSSNDNIHYLQGNALQLDFLNRCLKSRFDVIVDFMVYETEQFKERYEQLLNSTNQYIFLSSAKVFSESKKKLNEKSPRLLDTTQDQDFLKDEDYALYKAIEENLLIEQPNHNWTIIRPYITYSNQRLQLGTFEKERWLYRALQGRTVIFSEDIADKYTTLTYGADVANSIFDLMGKQEFLGESFNLTSASSMTWREVIGIYQSAFEEVTGQKMKVKYLPEGVTPSYLLGYFYQYVYDRRFDRIFDNSKIQSVSSIEYEKMDIGLQRCLREFILQHRQFTKIDWKFEAYADLRTGQITSLTEIKSFREKMRYLYYRFTPIFAYRAHKVRNLLRKFIN